MRSIGVLHPGAMGAAVAAGAKASGNLVYWASEGRSDRSRARADASDLTDAGSLRELCALCPAIVSVCPPEFAEPLCEQVLQFGFRGLYIDANATAPQRKQRMAGQAASRGARFVDGGIVGQPAKQRGSTFLVLSGPDAEEAASYFTEGPMTPEVIPGEVGKASALKMCFAGFSKGSTALIAAMLAMAEQYGVAEELKHNWERRGRSLAAIEREILLAASKSWRFAPEMQEIADTAEAVGLPGGFHLTAREIFSRLAEFKDRNDISLENVIQVLPCAESTPH